VEVLLCSLGTAQAPGLELFGSDIINASDYVTAAEQNNQSVPASIQALANTGSQSDVPAYSQSYSTPSASVSPSPTASSSLAASPSAPGTVLTSPSPLPSTAPTSTSSSSNPPYGLTTCPY